MTPDTKALSELVEALRFLANEVGALRAFEDEVRAAIGNTNWNCLMLRLAKADALLSSLSPELAGREG